MRDEESLHFQFPVFGFSVLRLASSSRADEKTKKGRREFPLSATAPDPERQ